MQAVAFPLPVTVIGEMLGIPVADRRAFQPWVRASTALLEITVGSDELIAAAAAGEKMYEYFIELLAERRRHPGEDLLSALLAARDGSDALTTDELISTATLLFGAGFETTTNLIGNGLLALLRHPDELTRPAGGPLPHARRGRGVVALRQPGATRRTDGHGGRGDRGPRGWERASRWSP